MSKDIEDSTMGEEIVHPHHHLTHNTDEREVSDRQLSKWKSEGGALPEDYDPDVDEDEPSGE